MCTVHTYECLKSCAKIHLKYPSPCKQKIKKQVVFTTNRVNKFIRYSDLNKTLIV